MTTLRSIGWLLSRQEYVGDGQGESESETLAPVSVNVDLVNAKPGDVCRNSEGDEEEEDSRDAQPLLIFYDCETTGFSIHNDHIADIGAKVVGRTYHPPFCIKPY